MSDENARDTGRDLWRWLILAALLFACLTAYFLYAPRVPPVVHPAQNAETP
jgi:uncharacterized BrkB/YihY/UPF0761 family membrane protein